MGGPIVTYTWDRRSGGWVVVRTDESDVIELGPRAADRWDPPATNHTLSPRGVWTYGRAVPLLWVWAWLAESADDPAEVAHAELVAGPVVGVRLWLAGDGELVSPFTQEPWCGGALTATCLDLGFDARAPLPPAHSAPGESCPCGIYALGRGADWDDLGSYAVRRDAVVGLVALSGRLRVAERGFRGERARALLLVRDCRCPDDAPCPAGSSLAGAPLICTGRARALARAGVSALAAAGELTSGPEG